MESAFVEKLLESLLWGYVCSVCRDVGLLAGNHGTVDKVRKGELSSLLSSLILLEASLSEIEIRTNGRSKDANNKLLIFSNNTTLSKPGPKLLKQVINTLLSNLVLIRHMDMWVTAKESMPF